MEKINYTCSLTPAYGRDYTNKADAIAAFVAGKDWCVHHLQFPVLYCSIRDFAPGTIVNLRYAKYTKSVPYALPEEEVKVPRASGAIFPS